MPDHRWRAWVLRSACASLTLLACHNPAAPARVDAGLGDAGPAPAFQIIAETTDTDEPTFRRAYGGGAFAASGGYRRLFAELEPSGKITPNKRVTSDLIGAIGEVGVQPDGILGVEGERWFDSASQRASAYEVAGSSVREVSDDERRVGYYPWKDGSVLVLRSSAVRTGVTDFPAIFTHTASFEALVPNGKTAPPVPKIPDGIAHADRFMAYPDGRVFLFAEPRKDHDGVGDIDTSAAGIYSLHDSAPPIPTPGFDATNALIPGDEFLLAKLEQPPKSRPMIARVDLAKRTLVMLDVDLPMPLRAVSRGDDGEIWLVTGSLEPGVGATYGSLYRGRIAADGVKLAVTSVDLKGYTPTDVLAHGAGDVWVVGRPADHDPYSGHYFILHLQPDAPAKPRLLDTSQIWNEAWAEKPPGKWDADCDTPLVVLGAGDEIDEAAITTAAAKHKKVNPSEAERGQLGGNDIWALRLPNYDAKSPNAPARVAKIWQADFPKAKLYCGGIFATKKLPIASE